MSNPNRTRLDNNVFRDVTLNFPQDIGQKSEGQQHYMIIDGYAVNIRQGFQADGDPDVSIALYIPPGALKTSYSSKYETFEGYQGVVSNVRDQAKGLSQSTAAGAYAQGAGALSGANKETGLMSIISGALGAEAAEGAGYALAKAVREKSDIGKAALMGAGVAVNPYLTVFYSGPGDFRTHTFSYDFIARNPNESKQIQKIITALKYRMLPGKFTTQSHSYFLTFPHQFRINFYLNGNVNNRDKVFSIKRSVLTNLSVDYGGAGVPVFFDADSYPFNIKLDVTFQEIKILTRENVAKGDGNTPFAGSV